MTDGMGWVVCSSVKERYYNSSARPQRTLGATSHGIHFAFSELVFFHPAIGIPYHIVSIRGPLDTTPKINTDIVRRTLFHVHMEMSNSCLKAGTLYRLPRYLSSDKLPASADTAHPDGN